MYLGIDFDNTIVCYDELFHQVGIEQQRIPVNLPPIKGEIRDYLRRCNQEDVWTEMQGYVYGTRMQDAAPFPGVLEFFISCKEQGIPLCIVSHKTRHPYRGPQYDLHRAALEWLELHGFFDPARIGLSEDNAYFELTKDAKIARIAKVGCTHFIDDLPEFLGEPTFPKDVKRILFDPNSNHTSEDRFLSVTSWDAIKQVIYG